MRFVAWLAGLVVIVVGAVFYRPLSDFGAEIWLIVATIASIWSMVLWNSTIVDRAVAPRDGDSRGLFTVLLLVATSNKGFLRSAQRSQPRKNKSQSLHLQNRQISMKRELQVQPEE